jgi:non-specific serine/threonine protein kinase
LRIVDDLYATAANCSAPGDIPRLAWLRGRALRELGELDEAERALVAAANGAEARASIGLLWRVHAALADLYQALGRDDQRDASLGAARAIIAHIVDDLPDDALKAAFRAGAAVFLPPGALEQPVGGSDPLTARERDVAILLTRGLSNREIAEHLFVGERTIETHVGNILAKLEFRSRTQIAAWAIENGLTEPRGATA